MTANALSLAFDLDQPARFLNQWKKPLIVGSLGVQWKSELDALFKPGTEAFIEALKRPNVTSFTRGAMAADLLRRRGVEKVIEVSCPSTFDFADNIVKSLRSLKDVDLDNLNEVWLNGYLGADRTSQDFIKSFRPFCNSAAYVMQDEIARFGILGEADVADLIYNDASGQLRFDAGSILKENDVEGLIYFSSAMWRARSAAVDLSVGQRFHGNLIAMQADRPAIFVAHDDRMVEMLSSLGFDYIPGAEWTQSKDRLEDLKSLIKRADIARMEDKYREAEQRFRTAITDTLSRA